MTRIKAPRRGVRTIASMNRGFRRSTRLLALWAMLMLAFVPTTGRLWKAAAGPHALVGEHHAGAHHGRGARPDAMQHGDGECAYCVLASGLASAGVQSPAVFASPAGSTLEPVGAVDGRRVPPRMGLGARGPPSRG